MKKINSGVLLTAAIALAAASTAQADSLTDGMAKMVGEGSASLGLRYRFETVEEDNFKDDARASTLQTRLTLKTATVNGFTALLEADDVSTIGADEYDSLMAGEYRGNHSVIADPVGTEINQAWVKYAFSDAVSSTVGRQRILHAGQRFVGGVGWRQNEQTYDAFSVNLADSGITLDYSYIWNVNRIFDGSGTPAVQAPEFDSDSHILLASMPVGGGKLSGFVYALDFEEAAALSSMTYGVSYAGSLDPVSFEATVAQQSDYGDNPVSYDALYLALEARVAINPVTLVGGYELLGSDDGAKAFATPLATLHKFQGWADLFLATPNDGIEDLYVGISGAAGKLALGAFFHDFSSDEGSTDYGSEVDLVATYPLNPHVKVQLKYADYSADDHGVDTQKLWFSVMANF